MFGIHIECFNLISTSEVNGMNNPADVKPEEVEEVDKMEEGWWYS